MNDQLISLLGLCGGLAFFLYGMNVMSSGLEKMAGSKLQVMLKKMTANPLKSMLLGAGITIAIQSSSAMTVMLVGLVNSGIMLLGQTICVIMGSNIGTTFTAWILSLSGIESNNFFLNIIKPENFSPVIALVGIILIMGKNDRRKNIGSIMIGFSVLMYGMEFMKDAVAPLASIPEFSSILTMFKNPILGVVVGAVVTGIIQSSAASIGILQSIALTGGLTYGMAIPIIMGQNIGTCVTAFISSIGVNKNAKRVSVIHILFNIIGTGMFLIIFYGIGYFIHFPFMDFKIDMKGIALVHSVFNISATLVLLPFTGFLEKASHLIVKDKKEEETYSFIDDRLLATPSIVISECFSLTASLAEKAKNAVFTAINLLNKYDEKTADKLINTENEIDMYEDKLGTVLVKISSQSLSEQDSHRVSTLLHTIGDFERIGDHAVNILHVARELHNKEIAFSQKAKEELEVLTKAICEILVITINAFTNENIEGALEVEPLEETIDCLILKIKENHIERLQKGSCTIELGFILSDLLNNLERISDHCSNIAVAMIQVDRNSFDTHEYLSRVRSTSNEDFNTLFRKYSNKYTI